MKKVEEIIKDESTKRSTIGTMAKLINYSKQNKNCYMCKQDLDDDKMAILDEKFPVDSQKEKFDDKIRTQKDGLVAYLKSAIENNCENHGLLKAIEIIEN